MALSDSPADGVTRSGYVFWSHQDNTYPALSQDHPVDWGTVTLTGWDRRTPFAFSDWPLRNTIRWIESPSLAKGVWTPRTENRLNDALVAAKRVVGSRDARVVNAVTKRLTDAAAGLRWADTRYPDPMDLPAKFTLPDPWTYLDGRRVTSSADWFRPGGRRDQILDLAQFYEYGYKPGAPITFTLYPPSDQARQAAGHVGPVPVVLSFGGYVADYGNAGYA